MSVHFHELLEAIFSIIFLIGIGYVLKRFQLVQEVSMAGMNKLCFYIFFPVKIAMSFYNTDMEGLLGPKFLVYILAMLFLQMALTSIFTSYFVKDAGRKIIEGHAMFRGNFIIMSFPILQSLCGDPGVAMAGAITGISQFFYNFYALRLFEGYTKKYENSLRIFTKILKTPLILGVFTGIFLYITKINISILESPMRSLGSIASPIALLTLGYSLDFQVNKDYLFSILRVSFMKLIFFPVIAFGIGIPFHFQEIQNIVSLVLFGSPTAVTTYVFARSYNIEPKLAGYLVFITTLLYALTIPILLKIFI
ncbi:MAG: AEC family transporter [Tissierellia bacterium]|nr:AEC family transporter [Tissierellia bacterium]